MNEFKSTIEAAEFDDKISKIEKFYRRVKRIEKDINKSKQGIEVENSFFEHNKQNNEKMTLIIEDVRRRYNAFESMGFDEQKNNISKYFELFKPYFATPGHLLLKKYDFKN